MKTIAYAAAALSMAAMSDVSADLQAHKDIIDVLSRPGRRWKPHRPEHHKAPPGARSGRYKGSNAAKAGARLASKRAKASARAARETKDVQIRIQAVYGRRVAA